MFVNYFFKKNKNKFNTYFYLNNPNNSSGKKTHPTIRAIAISPQIIKVISPLLLPFSFFNIIHLFHSFSFISMIT